jgi:hypothetical protein
MGYTWVAVDAETGVILNDLPDLTDGVGGTIKVAQTLGRYETVSAALPLPSAPPEWQRATLPMGAAIVLLADNPNDASHGVPVWGAHVTQRTRDESDLVQLSLATPEAYFDRRFVGTSPFTNVGQNTIVQTLVNNYVAAGPAGGIPIRVQVVTAGAGTLRTRTEYTDQADKTIYSVLQDLMGVQGGPEWFVGWEWQTNPERLTPVLYVGDRIGIAAANGLQPNAWFEMPGPVQSFQMVEDFSNGKGANTIMATGTGQGTSRPQSSLAIFVDPQRPTVEFRWTPSTSITDTATLNTYATAALGQIKQGSVTLSMSAVATDPACPQLGSDWGLGDDLGYRIGGLDANGIDTVPAFPGGISGTARAIGYTLDVTETPILTPVLAAPPTY